MLRSRAGVVVLLLVLLGGGAFAGYATREGRWFFHTPPRDPEAPPHLAVPPPSPCRPQLFFLDHMIYATFAEVEAEIDRKSDTRNFNDGTLLGFAFDESGRRLVQNVQHDGYDRDTSDLTAEFRKDENVWLLFSPRHLESFDMQGRTLRSRELPGGLTEKIERMLEADSLRTDASGTTWVTFREREDKDYRIRLARLRPDWDRGNEPWDYVDSSLFREPGMEAAYQLRLSRRLPDHAGPLFAGWSVNRIKGPAEVRVARIDGTNGLTPLPNPQGEKQASQLLQLSDGPGGKLYALWGLFDEKRGKYTLAYRVSRWDGRAWDALPGELGEFSAGTPAVSLLVTPAGEVVLASVEERKGAKQWRLLVRTWDEDTRLWRVVHPDTEAGLSLDPSAFKNDPQLWLSHGDLFLSWIEETDRQGFAAEDIFFQVFHDGVDPEKLRDKTSRGRDIFVLKLTDQGWRDAGTWLQTHQGLVPGLHAPFQHFAAGCP